MRFLIFVAVLLLATVSAHAQACRQLNDTVAFSNPVEEGDCYIVSVPLNRKSGSKGASSGRTVIYKIGKEADNPVHTFQWYDPAPRHLACGKFNGHREAILFVRAGASRLATPKGNEADLEFYVDGKLVHSYPAKYFASSGSANLLKSCGYALFARTELSARSAEGMPAHLTFKLQLSNRYMEFDPFTGAILQDIPRANDQEISPALKDFFKR